MSRYFTVDGKSTVKTLADRHGHAALVTSFLVVSTLMTLKDLELQRLRVSLFFCNFQLCRALE